MCRSLYAFVILSYFMLFQSQIGHSQVKTKSDSLIQIIQSKENDTTRINAMIALTSENKAYARQSFVDSAYRLSLKKNYYNGIARLLNTCGVLKWQKGDLDSAYYYFSKSLQLSEKRHLGFIAFRAANNLGILHLNRSNNDSAEHYLTLAFKLYKPEYDQKNFAKLNIDLGNFYISVSKFSKAHQHFLAAKSIYEKLQDSTNIITAYISLGILHYNLTDFEKCVANYYKVLSISTRWKIPPFFLATTYNNLGLAHMNLKRDLLLADYYFKKSIRIAEENNIPRIKMGAEVNAAIIHYERGDFRKTIQLNKDIMDRYNDQLNDLQRSALLINTGLAYNKLGEYQKALEPMQEGIVLATQVKTYEFVSKAYRSKYITDSIQGNYREALVNYKKHIQFRDSVANAEVIRTIHEQEVSFALQKKENELLLANSREELAQKTISTQKTFIYFIVALTVLLLGLILLGGAFYIKLKRLNHQLFLNQQKLETSQELIKQKNTELEKTNQTKDRFFSILAHDLRMPFSSLLGFLDLLTDDYDSMDDGRKKLIISSLRKTSYNTYELLENLLDWSKSQRGQIESVNEKTQVHSSVESILKLLDSKIINKQLLVENQIPAGLSAWADKKLLENIVLNLLNNAIKFTPKTGSIKIWGIENDGYCEICIQDSGIGIPSDKLKEIFSVENNFKRKGTAGESGTGLGLALCTEFVQMLHGKIWASSIENKGSSFYFSIPAYKNQKNGG